MRDPYNRDQLRQTYVDAWKKRLAAAALSPLEAMIAEVIELHPEYHGVVASVDAARHFEPLGGAVNPFLHMGLHLAVREQWSVDRPPGVRALHHSLMMLVGAHGAEHLLMEALEETLFEAQRCGAPPDEAAYISRVRARLAEMSSAGPARHRIK